MALNNNIDLEEIRAKADIVSIIGSYIPLTQKGRNYFAVCPFHDDHKPSMSISVDKQIYKCFSCGASGNVFTFVSEYENVPFMEAVRIVASKCGIDLGDSLYKSEEVNKFKEEYEIMNLAELFYQNNLRTDFGEVALKYLEERGINDEAIKEFGIGLSLDNNDSLKNLLLKKKYDVKKLVDVGLLNDVSGNIYDMFTRRITFPLWDKNGNIVGFSARVYRGEKDVSKYMNSRESIIFKKGETLYNYHNARNEIKRSKQVILVEGFMDVIRLYVNGIKNVVALQGTAMTKDQVNMLKKLRCQVILCFDNDNAGLIATLNNGEELEKNNVPISVIRLSGAKDPDEYILKNGKEAFINNVEKPMSYFDFKISYLKQDKDLNKALDLSEYINSVVSALAKEDDAILREVTLTKLSKEYGVSLNVLKEKLDSYKPVTLRKEEKEVPKVKVVKDGYIKAVEKVLYFMMNGYQYIKMYQEKLGFFEDALYREIANEIIYYFEQNKKITVADFITYVYSKENIKDKVMEITSESINEEVSLEAMDEYIKAILKVMNQNEIKRLKQEMKKELDADKKMKLAYRIQELKKGDA